MACNAVASNAEEEEEGEDETDPYIRDGYTPVHWAAYHGNIDGVRKLVAAGANINAATLVSRGCACWCVCAE